MFVDSHCHIDFPELRERLPELLSAMAANQVTHALCVSVNLQDFPNVLSIAESNDNIFASAGVHPDYENVAEPTEDQLVKLATHPRIVAIGETGLDYYRLTGDLEWQRQRAGGAREGTADPRRAGRRPGAVMKNALPLGL